MSAAGPLIYVIAGEPSGDALGAKIMAGLRAATGGSVRFAGIGGQEMAEQGLESRFPMDELAIMGLLEIVPHIPRLLRRIDETVREIERLKPAVLLTIDAPGFCFRVAKKLRGKGVPLVHLVAPTVWAWKPKRAEKIARFLDHLLVILPFEPPYFTRHGLATTYIGHPSVENPRGDRAAFRARHGIPAEATLLAVLPGSRGGEASRLLPVFGETVGRLAARHPDLHVAVPAVAGVHAMILEAVSRWPVKAVVTQGAAEKADLFAASDLALAAAGTAVLELVLAGLPTVAAYKVNALTYQMVRRMVKLPHATLPNILLGREMVPELLQDACTADALEAALEPLLAGGRQLADQQAAAAQLYDRLGGNGVPPSRVAADKVLEIAAQCATVRV
ncbi:lipid-A-disaccharide synthase [Oceanibaculum pacificum]|uniref:Lipid-A-disaccharide synthase n=1 Tax=Oceanibaculum pacificum TaxID=580166 RepID=A0A154W0P5_9PROT|nr:lipid-A-disaccharide synthase [Oceanibaculum pacificum]KZD07192.1 lipid-A-disaccharide synthase [Oceanibaculum pacificum]